MLHWVPANAQQVKATDFPPPKPAFPGQTNAPPPAQKSPALKVETLVQALDRPWTFTFLPDGKFLVTERYGTMRTAQNDGVFSMPIAGVPDVKVVAAQSLHDVELDPNFAQNRLIYFSYFAPPPGEDPAVWPNDYFYARVTNLPLAERRMKSVGTERVARARLSEDDKRLEHVQVLVDGVDRRIVFAPDGTLFISGADRFRFYASDMDGVEHEFTDPDILRNFTGRVARINPDGTIPKDNPFMSEATVLPETFAYGFRDPDGVAINPSTEELWIVEHGPMGGDRILIVRSGHFYGWPNVSYGRHIRACRGKGPARGRRRRSTDLFLVSGYRAFERHVLYGRHVSRMERKFVRGLAGGEMPDSSGAEWGSRGFRGTFAHGSRPAHPRCPPRIRWRALRAYRCGESAAGYAEKVEKTLSTRVELRIYVAETFGEGNFDQAGCGVHAHADFLR